MVSSPSAREGDLDGARPGRHGVALVLPAPREGHPVRRAHFDVLAARDVGAVDVDPVDAAGLGVDLVVHALPAPHLVGVGEEREHGLGWRRDPDLLLDDVIACLARSVSSISLLYCPLQAAQSGRPEHPRGTRAARPGPRAGPGR